MRGEENKFSQFCNFDILLGYCPVCIFMELGRGSKTQFSLTLNHSLKLSGIISILKPLFIVTTFQMPKYLSVRENLKDYSFLDLDQNIFQSDCEVEISERSRQTFPKRMSAFWSLSVCVKLKNSEKKVFPEQKQEKSRIENCPYTPIDFWTKIHILDASNSPGKSAQCFWAVYICLTFTFFVGMEDSSPPKVSWNQRTPT